MTSLNEGSARYRVLYLHNTQHTLVSMHAVSGIRTRSLSSQEAPDIRVRPRGYGYLLSFSYYGQTLAEEYVL